ncbi:hypothetical protein ABK040_000635 [Willaertia magna]
MFTSRHKEQSNTLANGVEYDDTMQPSSPTTTSSSIQQQHNNNDNNNSSDDEDEDIGIDITFTQIYNIIKEQGARNIPVNILQTVSKKDLVLSEFKREGMKPQFQRDAEYWYNTLNVFERIKEEDLIQVPFTLANDIAEKMSLIQLEKKRIQILRRIFICLRYGDILWRKSKKTNNWQLWSELKDVPIATMLSHGSRIIIQLPKSSQEPERKGLFGKLKNAMKKDESCHDHGFWTWLLCGDDMGNLEMVVTPELTNGAEAAKKSFLVFKRTAATHSLAYYDKEITPKEEEDSSAKKKKKLQSRKIQVQYVDENGQEGTLKKIKDIVEVKEKLGLNARNTKIMGSKEELMLKHRHWGLNICMGGFGKELPCFPSAKDAKKARKKGVKKGTKPQYTICEPTGEHSHIYLYYMSPGPKRNGGIMIGVEGSEPGKKDQSGEHHGITASSPFIGVTDGMKWNKIKDMGFPEYPDKYDAFFIDLSNGWEFLKQYETEWKDEMVFGTTYLKPVNEAMKEAQLKEKQLLEENDDIAVYSTSPNYI